MNSSLTGGQTYGKMGFVETHPTPEFTDRNGEELYADDLVKVPYVADARRIVSLFTTPGGIRKALLNCGLQIRTTDLTFIK